MDQAIGMIHCKNALHIFIQLIFQIVMFLTVAVFLGILSLLVWIYTSRNLQDQLEETMEVLRDVRHDQLEAFQVCNFPTSQFFILC